MRVAIAALGTRGDVWPYVVLGRGLRAAGHDVLIGSTERFQGLVEDAGLGFHLLPGDPADLLTGRIDVSPLRPLRHMRVIHAAVGGLVGAPDPRQLADAWADRDTVVVTPSTTFTSVTAAHLGARCAMVVMTPAAATGAFAHPVLTPRLPLGRHGNLASWFVAERLLRPWFKEPLRPSARRAWGLPAFALSLDRRAARWPPFPLLHAFSPAVVPTPADWPPHATITGWLLPEPSTEPLPERVERFLDRGPPPLYLGFGSMPVPDAEGLARVLLGALRRSGHRAVVVGAGLARARALREADSVLAVAEVPHERLLHRVRAVVHHGGSGTVGAGLRAGRPTLVVPFVFDQFFWGDRVRALGAGPPPVPFRWLSEDRLARGLTALTSGRYDDAARRLGERVGAEDGVARAVEQLERAGA